MSTDTGVHRIVKKAPDYLSAAYAKQQQQQRRHQPTAEELEDRNPRPMMNYFPDPSPSSPAAVATPSSSSPVYDANRQTRSGESVSSPSPTRPPPLASQDNHAARPEKPGTPSRSSAIGAAGGVGARADEEGNKGWRNKVAARPASPSPSAPPPPMRSGTHTPYIGSPRDFSGGNLFHSMPSVGVGAGETSPQGGIPRGPQRCSVTPKRYATDTGNPQPQELQGPSTIKTRRSPGTASPGGSSSCLMHQVSTGSFQSPVERTKSKVLSASSSPSGSLSKLPAAPAATAGRTRIPIQVTTTTTTTSSHHDIAKKVSRSPTPVATGQNERRKRNNKEEVVDRPVKRTFTPARGTTAAEATRAPKSWKSKSRTPSPVAPPRVVSGKSVTPSNGQNGGRRSVENADERQPRYSSPLMKQNSTSKRVNGDGRSTPPRNTKPTKASVPSGGAVPSRSAPNVHGKSSSSGVGEKEEMDDDGVWNDAQDLPRTRVASYPVESVAEDDAGKFGARYADDDEALMGHGHCMELPTTTIEERLEYLNNRDRRRLDKLHLKKLSEQGIARRPDTLVRSKYGPIKALGYRSEGGPKAIMGRDSQPRSQSAAGSGSTRLAIQDGEKQPARHARSCTPSGGASRHPVMPSGAGVMQIDKD